MKRRLICITDRPFDRRLKDHYWDIRKIESYGFEFHYWSLGRLVYAQDSSVSVENLIEISDTRDLETLLRGIELERDFVYMHFSKMMCLDQDAFELNVLVDRLVRNYCVAVTGWGDNPMPPDEESSRFRSKFRRLKSSLRRAASSIKHSDYKTLRASTKYFLYLLGLPVFQGPLFWIARTRSGFRLQYPDCFPSGSRTRILWTHSTTYDDHLTGAGADPQEQYCTFLDQYIPFVEQYGVSYDIDPDRYYGPLRRFLLKVSRQHGRVPLVCTHPEASLSEVREYFPDVQVVQNQTMEYISKSFMVIAHSSTAINYAVLRRKPVVIVTNDEVEKIPLHKAYIYGMAAALGKRALALDGTLELDDPALQVDAQAYETYESNHIKVKGSEKELYWDIVMRRILRAMDQAENTG